jgi:hypothetical protein
MFLKRMEELSVAEVLMKISAQLKICWMTVR